MLIAPSEDKKAPLFIKPGIVSPFQKKIGLAGCLFPALTLSIKARVFSVSSEVTKRLWKEFRQK
tara:strand:+ start:425 stop:616 length:192 start_codon:yes stop_codon:yes gene_type:complete